MTPIQLPGAGASKPAPGTGRAANRHSKELVIVTGISGSGKASAWVKAWEMAWALASASAWQHNSRKQSRYYFAR